MCWPRAYPRECLRVLGDRGEQADVATQVVLGHCARGEGQMMIVQTAFLGLAL